MAIDANFTHNSQPDGRDDDGNPLWLGQNLPDLLTAAHTVACQQDQAAGTTEHVDHLFETLIMFAGGLTKRRARQPRPILSNIASADDRQWCGAPREIGGQQLCPVESSCPTGTCAIIEPIPGWHG
jgi:hypothetical protein